MTDKNNPQSEPFYPMGKPDESNPDEGKARVSKMLDDAQPVEGGRVIDPSPGHQSYGYRPGEWRDAGFIDAATGLPVECPIQPLGYDEDNYWFIDAKDQVRVIPAGKFSRNVLLSLFMTKSNWAKHHWPKSRDGKNVSGISADQMGDEICAMPVATKAIGMMLKKCAGAALGWMMRVICWVHCGDRLVIPGGEKELGEHDGFVYPSRPAIPAPLFWQ